MRSLGFALVITLLAGSLAAQEVTDRFERWSDMPEEDFRYDPDDRRIMGFSVRASTGARTTLDDVERAWGADAPERAVSLLRDLAMRSGGEVIQVAGELEIERWVGAAEWALYQLRLRASDSVMAGLLPREDREAVRQAVTWRDVDGLQLLAWRLEGTPQGLEATTQLAHLLAERGAWGSSRHAAGRALTLGAGESMQEVLDRLPVASDPLDAPERMPPDLDRVWMRPLTIGELAVDYDYAENPFPGPSYRYEAPFSPVQPVVSEDVVFVADSVSVSAWDLRSGRTLWHHAGPIERVMLDGTESSRFDFEIYAARNRVRAISPFQCARPVLSGNTVLATVQATEAWRALEKFEGYPINHPLPKRRLRALHRDSGELLWMQERPDQSDRAFVNSFDVAGPPALGGGIAYVSGSVTEGAINAYLAAFDVETGDLLWKTLLCSGQQELTMFNRPFQEHVISPPLLADDALYVSTNLGVIGCVDAWSGRVRWLTRYESITRQGVTGVIPNRRVRLIHWQNQEPFIEDDTLLIAPLDSMQLLALDPQTGRLAYRLETYVRTRRSPVRHQALPRGDGNILIVSDMGIECIEARTGDVVWPHKPFEASDAVDYAVDVTGAATRSGDTLLVPCARKLVLVDVHSGEVTGAMDWQKFVRSPEVQRVVHAGSAFVMNDGRDVFAAMDVDRLLAEAEGRSPGSPEDQLTLAELALAGRRYEEARRRFDSLLKGGGGTPQELRPDALLSRARSGRLEAAVLYARLNDTADDWNAVLEVAETTEQLFAWSPEALDSLDREDRDLEVADWLEVLAARAPDRLVDFGPDESQPASMLAARHRLPFVSTEKRLALLQELLLTAPDMKWGGLTVREEARRRIDALLEEHGRDLYAELEERARADLDRGLPLEVVEVRYPNSLAVANERMSELDRLLESGRAREAFERVAQLSGTADVLALRERAARALGETEYAGLLSGGRPLRTGMDPLPRLPRSGGGLRSFQMSSRHDVVLPQVTGETSPEFASCVLGVIGDVGEMFLMDAREGVVRWRGRGLPGGLLRGHGRLDVRFENELFVIRAGDSIEVGRLSDGHPIWSTTTSRLMSTTTGGGLVFLLREYTGHSLRIDAFGLRTGAHAYSIDLQDAQSASDLRFVGPYLITLTQSAGSFGGPVDVRLIVLDIERGEVASSTRVDDNLRMVNALSDPPTVFLAAQLRGAESRLEAWNPATASMLWEAVLPEGVLKANELFPTAPGRMLYCESTTAGNIPGQADILHPIDAVHGPLDPPVGLPLYRVLTGDGGSAAPLVVMQDPVSKQKVCVLDGATAEVLYTLEFDTRLDGHTEVHQASDGYVIVSETSYDPTFIVSAWIVHGEDGQERYSVQLDEPDRRAAAEVLLVDDAVLIAIGGTVHVIRDDMSSR